MLVVASAIRQKRREVHPDARWTMKGHTTDKRDARSLATHLGFFESFGAPITGTAQGAESYLPITNLNVQQLLGGQKYSKIAVVKRICEESDRLATVLCQGHDANILRPIAFSLREVMRNCLEHGATHEFWYAAQYRPARNRVEIAVLDEGRGVAASLRHNPALSVPDDTAAIRLAFQEGVTSFTGSNRSVDSPPDPAVEYGHDPSYYDNSGYGLYVLSQLCKTNGNVLLLSGNRSLRLDRDGESIREGFHKGTAVRIVLHPQDIGVRFKSVLDEVRSTTLSKSARLSVSMLDSFN